MTERRRDNVPRGGGSVLGINVKTFLRFYFYHVFNVFYRFFYFVNVFYSLKTFIENFIMKFKKHF